MADSTIIKENRKTLAEFRAWLDTLPPQAMLRAYQGEWSGVVAESSDGEVEFSILACDEADRSYERVG